MSELSLFYSLISSHSQCSWYLWTRGRVKYNNSTERRVLPSFSPLSVYCWAYFLISWTAVNLSFFFFFFSFLLTGSLHSKTANSLWLNEAIKMSIFLGNVGTVCVPEYPSSTDLFLPHGWSFFFFHPCSASLCLSERVSSAGDSTAVWKR